MIMKGPGTVTASRSHKHLVSDAAIPVALDIARNHFEFSPRSSRYCTYRRGVHGAIRLEPSASNFLFEPSQAAKHWRCFGILIFKTAFDVVGRISQRPPNGVQKALRWRWRDHLRRVVFARVVRLEVFARHIRGMRGKIGGHTRSPIVHPFSGWRGLLDKRDIQQ